MIAREIGGQRGGLHVIGQDQHLRAGRLVELERAGEYRLSVDVFEPGRFQYFHLLHAVFQGYLIPVDIEAQIVRPVLGQRALQIRTRITEAALFRPTRPGLCAEDRIALHLRRRRPLNPCHCVSEFQKLSRPRQRQPHQVGVVANVGLPLSAEGDHDAFHSGLCRGRCRTRTVRESIHPLPAGRRQTESGPCRRERKPPTHGKLEIAFSPDFKGFQARLVDPEALGRKEMPDFLDR